MKTIIEPTVRLKFEEYDYECGDGCCYEWGLKTTVNGKLLEIRNEDARTMVPEVLKELGYQVIMEDE